MISAQTASDDTSAIAADPLATGEVTARFDGCALAEHDRAVARPGIPFNRNRTNRQNHATRFWGAIPADGRGGSLKRRVRKLFLLLSGSTGATVVSTTALWAALFVAGSRGPYLYALPALLVLIRAVYHVARDTGGLFCPSRIRKHVRHVLSDEIQVSIALIATAYVLGWPFPHTAAGIFVAGNLSLQLGTLFFTRLVLRILAKNADMRNNHPGKRQVIIVGTGQKARRAAATILDSPELETSIKGFLDYRKTGLWRYRDVPLMGRPERFGQIISTAQVDAVVVAVEAKDLPRTRRLFTTAEKMGVTLYFIPDIHRPRLTTPQPTWVNGSPALVYHQAIPEGHLSHLVKDVIDRVGAIVGIILAAPLLLLAAVAIKIDSPGPVLFRQKRCGLNGRQFGLYKFRTMFYGAEREKHRLQDLNHMSGPVFKIKNDPRVTRVGRVLRRCSIDEVPQFFNVLRGDMSLVGPRPPLPEEVARYEPWQRRRLSVKPGVTCLWQVNGRNNIDFEQWMRLDLQYIDNWSLWLDTKILARTIPAVVKGTGAS